MPYLRVFSAFQSFACSPPFPDNPSAAEATHSICLQGLCPFVPFCLLPPVFLFFVPDRMALRERNVFYSLEMVGERK